MQRTVNANQDDAAWIRQNGIDKNLGSTNQRSNNNNLTIMLPSSDDDDDEVEVVANAKIDFTQTNVGKVRRMQEHCRGAITYNIPIRTSLPTSKHHKRIP
jgi:lipoate synthase